MPSKSKCVGGGSSFGNSVFSPRSSLCSTILSGGPPPLLRRSRSSSLAMRARAVFSGLAAYADIRATNRASSDVLFPRQWRSRFSFPQKVGVSSLKTLNCVVALAPPVQRGFSFRGAGLSGGCVAALSGRLERVLVVFLKQMQHGRASDAYRVRALGMDRLALTLFATRGLEMAELPKTVRRALALSA